jgi:hypothetical protein
MVEVLIKTLSYRTIDFLCGYTLNQGRTQKDFGGGGRFLKLNI